TAFRRRRRSGAGGPMFLRSKGCLPLAAILGSGPSIDAPNHLIGALEMSDTPEAPRPPLPPFTHATAVQKVQLAEDAWNSRDPVRVSLAYTPDSRWRNRSEFPVGRAQ